jgi:hypothetical protein
MPRVKPQQDCFETRSLAYKEQLLPVRKRNCGLASQAAVVEPVSVNEKAALAVPASVLSALAQVQRLLNQAERIAASHVMLARSIEVHV